VIEVKWGMEPVLYVKLYVAPPLARGSAVRGGEKRRHFRRDKAEPTEPGRRSRPAV
jgi:hypothetical protein